MDSFAFDLRDAFRRFRRDRAYAATVILTLALTIGATTAVFSVVDGVLLKPLPYPEPNRLVALQEIWKQFSGGAPVLEVNERHFAYWREHARSFESLSQYVVLPENLTGRGDAARISVAHCDPSLFRVLQAQAALGRTLTETDGPESAADVVAISDRLWRQRFDADPRAVGSAIAVSGKLYTVVGVLPASFRLPTGRQMSGAVDAFVPIRLTAGWVGDHNNEAIGRLRAGVPAAQARAELDVLETQISEIATRVAHEPVTLASSLTPLTEYVVGRSRQGLLLLLIAIGAVLLIGCSNLANLALTRALRRQRETAIRAALGANSRRLMARAVLEQLILSTGGGGLGVWVAWAAIAVFVRTAPVDIPRLDEVTLDVRVLAFAALVSILTGTLVALVPEWRTGRQDTERILRSGAPGAGGDSGGNRRRAVLLTLQVALSVTLLSVTGLLGVSFLRVLNADRGFRAERVLSVELALPAARYAEDRVRQAAYERLLAAVGGLPGVEKVSTTSLGPLRGQGQVNLIAREGNTLPLSSLPQANFRSVAPEYFSALGIALLRGRFFTDRERDGIRPIPALVSAPAAAVVWPGGNPIGKRFTRGLAGDELFEVVGVAADAHTTYVDRAQPLMVYVPYWWHSRASTTLLIRTAGDPATVPGEVRRAVREIDGEIAIGQTRTLEQVVDSSLGGRRYQAQLLVVFGLAALFIAALGIYAMTSYNVTFRRREINVRLALGARTGQVVGMVLQQSMRPIVAGLAAGTGGTLALGSVVAGLLFEVQAHDPAIMAAVVAMVGATGLGACGLATRRWILIDPAAALREE